MSNLSIKHKIKKSIYLKFIGKTIEISYYKSYKILEQTFGVTAEFGYVLIGHSELSRQSEL